MFIDKNGSYIVKFYLIRLVRKITGGPYLDTTAVVKIVGLLPPY